MKDRYYMEMLRRAVLAKDERFLQLMAQQLREAEDAKRVLRLKGYGKFGMSTGDTARLVPQAK